MELYLGSLLSPVPDDLPVEIVERKGLGHPDTLCDALAEEFSRALSRHYLERFDCVLHHNVDKALLWGGAARPAFGGGEVLAPCELYLSGRATDGFRGEKVPVAEIAETTCRRWLRERLHAFDVEHDIRIHCLTRSGSAELVELFQRQWASGEALANDSSVGVGFAPASVLERVVLGVERSLNEVAAKQRHPALGEDVKVLGVRVGHEITLTIACAVVGRYVANLDEYLAAKQAAVVIAQDAARAVTDWPVRVEVNAADDYPSESLYLTVTGTSAEAGDDGQVGRGNRVGGLITPYRPMVLEAAAGKNAVTHVGKLYNVLARDLAEALVRELPRVRGAECFLVSQIGRPVLDPHLVDIRLRLQEGAVDLSRLRTQVDEIVQRVLADAGTLWQRAVRGQLAVC